MEPEVIEFLQQSNYIEGVTDSQSLDLAVSSWKYIIGSIGDLTDKHILFVHKILMENQPIQEKDKGAWRTESVMVGGRVKHPWYAIEVLMDGWIKAVNNSLKSKYLETGEQKKGVVIAMHVNFENIHPFIDGNGRVGRILMNWQLRKFGLPILVIREEEKQEYYKWFK